MSVLGGFNILLLLWVARKVFSDSSNSSGFMVYRKRQLWLSALYTLGCASRSFVIRSDVNRYSMFDSWITNVMVGRTVATVAEICFVVQWALLLHLIASRRNIDWGRYLSWTLVPLIVIAEIASWYAVLTTNRLGNIIEESLWTITAMLFMIGLAICYAKVGPHVKKCLKFGFFSLISYILFMVTVDVPNYISLWYQAEHKGQVYLTIEQGLQDIQRYRVTGLWEDWRYEMVWMSLYFSLAVWVSLAMVLWPKFERDPISENGSQKNV